MTALPRYESFLRQISKNAAEGSEDSLYPLSPDKTIVIGREASCDIVLDSNDYLEVSRQHLQIRPMMSNDIHALFDFVVMLQEQHQLNEISSNILLASIGSLAYLCLMAAILRAKKLTPIAAH